MAKLTKDEMLKTVEENVKRLEDKTFNVYFFTLDTKGNPSPSLAYIYKIANFLLKEGYNVTMLHDEKNFVGVGDWMGEEYANIPHSHIESKNVLVNASDFLFIPEIFANVATSTKKLPCKRVILVQNYKHITEFLPVSLPYDRLGISDIIAIDKKNADMTQKYFPEVRTHIVHPSISGAFRSTEAPRKLLINIMSRDVEDANQFVKPFYWMEPMYKWVSFRDIRGYSKELEAEALRDAFATIWIDDKNNTGQSLLEALRCGSIVLAKVPNDPAEWMLAKSGDLTEKVIWFDTLDQLPSMIASLVRSWTLDKVPEDVYADQSSFDGVYTEEDQEKEIREVFIEGLFNRRLKEFTEVLSDVKNNKFKTNEEE